jgi:hypothetical protein
MALTAVAALLGEIRRLSPHAAGTDGDAGAV